MPVSTQIPPLRSSVIANGIRSTWTTPGQTTTLDILKRPPPGRATALDVLKRVASDKDQEEVFEGFECTLHVKGFDALLPGDGVEAYRFREK